MTAVLDQVKNVAYTGVGVNLVVTDAIIGREVPAPKAVTEHAATARAKGTEVLTDLRGRTEPLAARVVERLPEQVADAVETGRKVAWDFLGIDLVRRHILPGTLLHARSDAVALAFRAAGEVDVTEDIGVHRHLVDADRANAPCPDYQNL